MFCQKCGYQGKEGEMYCNNCGNTLQQVNNGYNSTNNNMANNYSNVQNSYNGENSTYNKVPNMNGYNNINYSQQNASRGIPVGIAVIVGLVMLLIIGIMGFILAFSGSKDLDKRTSDNIKSTYEDDETVVVKKKDQKVVFGDFQVSVPRQYLYELSGKQLIIYDEDETWLTVLECIGAKYSDLAREKMLLKAAFEQQGVTVESLKEKTVDGKEMIVAEVEHTGQKGSFIYTEADENNVLYAAIASLDGTYGQEVLEELSSVIASIEPASYSGYAANIEIDHEKVLKEISK